MKDEWKEIEFEIVLHKETLSGIYYKIKTFEEIGNLLDDHIVNTQMMAFSPFKAHFEEEISEWENNLRHMLDVLEEWMKVQADWMYLQPIFESKDIAKQLADESKKFGNINKFWKREMGAIIKSPNTMKTCLKEGLLEDLRDVNEKLEVIRKALAAYLEKKRAQFSRFYFLADEDLLEILSEAKNPIMVQPHLAKIFENINRI